MMYPNLNIAIAQADLAWKDKPTNFLKFERWFDTNREPLDLVVLPEMFATGFVTEPQDVAETMDGTTVKWMVNQAKNYKFTLIGSVIITENGKYYNRLLVVDRNGEIQTYDKKHLFTYGGEDKQFSAGNKKLIIDLYGWKICPLVCYDLRFPVWAKNNFKDQLHDYDVLIYIANWPSVRAFAFRQLLIARAIENQCYTIGVNRVGVDGKGLYYQGNSTVLDYNGNHLLEIDPDKEAFEVISISYESLSKERQRFPVAQDWDNFEIIK